MRLWALFLLALSVQAGFWWHSHRIPPVMEITPRVPSQAEVQILALGDAQTYYRMAVLQLQSAGDTFGRVTSLKDYDYQALLTWFRLFDQLDARTDLSPAVAAYYYGQTPKVEDLRPIITFLHEHAKRDLAHKWWWMTQAVYLANAKLEDSALAVELAQELVNAPGEMPLWARQMAAFIHEQRGEKDAALAIIDSIAHHIDHIPEHELRFMKYFIEDRLQAHRPDLLPSQPMPPGDGR